MLKVKKVSQKKAKYDKPGQTKPTPPENDSLRKFYTSLLSQNPNSEMAIRWCTEHGLVSVEEVLAGQLALQIKKLTIKKEVTPAPLKKLVKKII